MTQTVLTGARLVLERDIVTGTLVMDGDLILAAEPGRSGHGTDLDGDYLIAGIVDLHTDNLERQVQPRSSARWPSRSAFVAHDAQVAAAGVTTVLDALCVGDLGYDSERIQTFHEGVTDLDALADTGLLKSEHFLHLRCELPAEDMLTLLDPVADHGRVRMVSLMDHSPGVGQHGDIERYRAMRRREGHDEATVDRHIADLLALRARVRDPNRRALLARIAHLGVALASHDDRTADDIAENAADGIRISEFPVTLEAALAAKAAGMDVIAGAPNIVRGGSHSGNVAVSALLAADAVDALASDYVPASLIEAAFAIADGDTGLARAIGLVTAEPARMAGLHDRGRLLAGLRADVVRVRVHEGLAIVRAVWRGGERVA